MKITTVLGTTTLRETDDNDLKILKYVNAIYERLVTMHVPELEKLHSKSNVVIKMIRTTINASQLLTIYVDSLKDFDDIESFLRDQEPNQFNYSHEKYSTYEG